MLILVLELALQAMQDTRGTKNVVVNFLKSSENTHRFKNVFFVCLDGFSRQNPWTEIQVFIKYNTQCIYIFVQLSLRSIKFKL